MSRRKPKFFKDFEIFLGNKFPIVILNILLDCGFDNKLSLSLLKEESIKHIENHVNKNKHLIKNTNYEKLENFEFSIGHKLLITSIPENLKKFNQENKNKPPQNSEEEAREEKSEKGIDNFDPNSLKTGLLTKLQKYALKFNFNYIVEESDITKFSSDRKGFKCFVKCPLCASQFSCIYRKYWITSNFTNHIRTHFKSTSEVMYVEVVPSTNASEITRLNNEDLPLIIAVSMNKIN